MKILVEIDYTENEKPKRLQGSIEGITIIDGILFVFYEQYGEPNALQIPVKDIKYLKC